MTERFEFLGTAIRDTLENNEIPYNKDGFQDVCELLNEQHETIQKQNNMNKLLHEQLDERDDAFDRLHTMYMDFIKEHQDYEQKVKGTLQKHNKILKDKNKVLNNDNGSIGLLEYIADELGIDLQ